MKIFAALKNAWQGWIQIVRNHEGWRALFRLNLSGLATALALYYLFSFLAVVLASLDVGVPTPQGLFNIMLIQSLWLVALALGVYGTRFAVRDTQPVLPVLIPGIYALIAYLVAGTLLSMVLGVLLPLLWLGLAWMFFRLGRMASGWSVGVAVAFAALTVVLLVGIPMTLYMLVAALPPA